MAYLHAQGVDLTQAGAENSTPSFQNFFGAFPGETISKKANSTEWDPSHTYYWPKGEKSYVDFIGWYGTAQPTVAYAMNNDKKWEATMTWNFTTSFGQTTSNLMYADMAWRYKENVKPATHGSSGATEGVPMLFHHALAQINIKAYVAADNEEDTLSPVMTPDNAASIGNGVTDGNATWTVTIKNAKIGKINSAGTLVLKNVDPGTDAATTQAWTGSWSGTDTAADVTIDNCTVDKVTKADAKDLIAPSCVLPQSLTGVALDFDVEIVTTYSNPNNPNKEVLHFNIPFSAMNSTAWNMNTKYTYYLRIVPNQNKVLFDPALEADWVEVEAGEKII